MNKSGKPAVTKTVPVTDMKQDTLLPLSGVPEGDYLLFLELLDRNRARLPEVGGTRIYGLRCCYPVAGMRTGEDRSCACAVDTFESDGKRRQAVCLLLETGLMFSVPVLCLPNRLSAAE